MSYHSTKYFAEKWGVTESTVCRYCRDGKIPKARKCPKTKKRGKWEVPSEALRPVPKRTIPFLLMYYNCLQTNFDVRTTNVPYIQRFIALDYSAEARNFLVQMGYINEVGACTPAGFKMMNRELEKQHGIKLVKWFSENAPEVLKFLPYF